MIVNLINFVCVMLKCNIFEQFVSNTLDQYSVVT